MVFERFTHNRCSTSRTGGVHTCCKRLPFIISASESSVVKSFTL